jgi:hypothetical protein
VKGRQRQSNTNISDITSLLTTIVCRKFVILSSNKFQNKILKPLTYTTLQMKFEFNFYDLYWFLLLCCCQNIEGVVLDSFSCLTLLMVIVLITKYPFACVITQVKPWNMCCTFINKYTVICMCVSSLTVLRVVTYVDLLLLFLVVCINF